MIVTTEENALSNHTISLDGVSPCRHKEADTRIFVHATQEVSTSLLVKASDTDILVIAISVMPTLQAISLQQLWIAFGQGRNMRWIPAHELYRSIGTEKDRGIIFMPSLIAMWYQPSVVKEINLHVLRLLMYLLDSASTPTVNDNEVDILEKFVVMMYDNSSTASR